MENHSGKKSSLSSFFIERKDFLIFYDIYFFLYFRMVL